MYENPDDCRDVDAYLHRIIITRGVRHGRKRIAINFMTKYDIDTLNKIQLYYKTQIEMQLSFYSRNYQEHKKEIN